MVFGDDLRRRRTAIATYAIAVVCVAASVCGLVLRAIALLCASILICAGDAGLASAQQTTFPFLQDGGARDAFVRGAISTCVKNGIANAENWAVSQDQIQEFCGCYARALADIIDAKDFETLTREGKPSATLSSKTKTASTICQNATNLLSDPRNGAKDSRKSLAEILTEAQVPNTARQAYERGRTAALKAEDAAKAQQPYAFSVGLFLGATGACLLLRSILGWLATGWPRTLTRIAVLNVFAFLLASWLYAHGLSLSRSQDFTEISALHTYFLPQCVIFILDVCLYFLRRGKEPEKVPVRIEPTL
jgi:hypothetical protein